MIHYVAINYDGKWRVMNTKTGTRYDDKTYENREDAQKRADRLNTQS